MGSGVLGVAVEGTDDRDELGIAIAPPSCSIGLELFEQYQFRTQPEGVRSGTGDLDLVIYDLRKYARLASQGNPTVLLPLFTPDWGVVHRNAWGERLQQDKQMFLSKDCGRRFMGCLDSQRDKLLGLRSPHTNRPELIAKYGFDSKFAYQAVRLGFQGVEILATGAITLPIPEPDRTWIKELRVGGHTKEEVLDRVAESRSQLERLLVTSDLPDKPDYGKINDWLTEMHTSWWRRS